MATHAVADDEQPLLGVDRVLVEGPPLPISVRAENDIMARSPSTSHSRVLTVSVPAEWNCAPPSREAAQILAVLGLDARGFRVNDLPDPLVRSGLIRMAPAAAASQ